MLPIPEINNTASVCALKYIFDIPHFSLSHTHFRLVSYSFVCDTQYAILFDSISYSCFHTLQMAKAMMMIMTAVGVGNTHISIYVGIELVKLG